MSSFAFASGLSKIVHFEINTTLRNSQAFHKFQVTQFAFEFGPDAVDLGVELTTCLDPIGGHLGLKRASDLQNGIQHAHDDPQVGVIGDTRGVLALNRERTAQVIEFELQQVNENVERVALVQEDDIVD
jgi:hypothetical protein